MALSVSVTVRQVLEDGSEVPADGELASALAGTAEQFSAMLAWAAGDAGGLDHGKREEVIGQDGRELQRRLLEATLAIDSAREERVTHVTSAAGIRHGSVETGHDRGVVSIFGPVRATRLAYRNRRERPAAHLRRPVMPMSGRGRILPGSSDVRGELPGPSRGRWTWQASALSYA